MNKGLRYALIILMFAVIFIPGFYCFLKGTGDYVSSRDMWLSPVEYRDRIYFVSGKQHTELTELGYVMDRDNIMDVVFSPLFSGVLNVIDNDENYLRVKQHWSASYTNSTLLETREYTGQILKSYDSFELLYKDAEKELYLGTKDIPKELVLSLEQEFGQVIYREDDFKVSGNYYICKIR